MEVNVTPSFNSAFRPFSVFKYFQYSRIGSMENELSSHRITSVILFIKLPDLRDIGLLGGAELKVGEGHR